MPHEKAFLLLCALLLVLGSALPLAGYRLARPCWAAERTFPLPRRPAPPPYRKPRLPLSRATQMSSSSKT